MEASSAAAMETAATTIAVRAAAPAAVEAPLRRDRRAGRMQHWAQEQKP